MSDDAKPSKAALDTAEKILVAIYGEDLTGCSISLDVVAGIIQERLVVETKNYKMLNEALIGAIRQIRDVSTPPDKQGLETIEDVVGILSERADAIHKVTSQILEAWEKARD